MLFYMLSSMKMYRRGNHKDMTMQDFLIMSANWIRPYMGWKSAMGLVFSLKFKAARIGFLSL